MKQDFMDTLAILSFVLGAANYEENLTQNDKDDLMSKVDKQTQEILEQLHEEIDKQNRMLEEILRLLKERE